MATESITADADERCKPGDIFRLIPKVMEELGPIGKGRTNEQQRYKFRGIDDVYNAVHPLITKNGIFVVPFVVEIKRQERETKNGGVLFYTYALIDHRFYAPDGSFVTARTIGEAMDSGDKSGNKAQSAAMKYAYIEVFAIPTMGDNDTENHNPEPAPRQQSRQNNPPQTAPRQDANPAAQQGQPSQGGAAATGPKASPAQVAEVKSLLESRQLPAGMVENWFGRAGVISWEQMSADAIAKCISYLKSKKPAARLTFDDFMDKAFEISRSKRVADDWHNQAIAKFIEANGGAPYEIPAVTLIQTLAAIERDRFDYSTGKIKEPAAPAAA